MMIVVVVMIVILMIMRIDRLRVIVPEMSVIMSSEGQAHEHYGKRHTSR